MTKAKYRPIGKKEREGLLELCRSIDHLREIVVALRKLGVETVELSKFDNGAEVIRALATDTHSLVREYNT